MGNVAAEWSAFVQAMGERERRFPGFLNEPVTEDEIAEDEEDDIFLSLESHAIDVWKKKSEHCSPLDFFIKKRCCVTNRPLPVRERSIS
ncbi:hypothetical protein GCM10010912_49050 [Paenibacillus albidus]|uniref:Uncharacterized protein n=1 Tax=Paenibacillus albidus TaxID=2041023 RepID=A0A917CTQ5_9BACL|nr:hypothetical protein [Paenibacillus albidus]GGF98543.1 hypothetical protein GCM10010912_49050 [Paenibacillus albidus]